MIHQPLGGAQGQATEIKIAAERILKLKKKLNKILAEVTGKDITTIDNDTERDYFMDSMEALNYGIVDKILKIELLLKFYSVFVFPVLVYPSNDVSVDHFISFYFFQHNDSMLWYHNLLMVFLLLF